MSTEEKEPSVAEQKPQQQPVISVAEAKSNNNDASKPAADESHSVSEDTKSNGTFANLSFSKQFANSNKAEEEDASKQKSNADPAPNNNSNSTSSPEQIPTAADGNGSGGSSASTAQQEKGDKDSGKTVSIEEQAESDVEPPCLKIEHTPTTDDKNQEEKAATGETSKESEKTEEEKPAGKRALPKWMVQDAEEVELEPEPEPPKKSPKEAEAPAAAKGRGRGRGRPVAAGSVAKPVTPKAAAPVGNAGTSAAKAAARDVTPPSRPRRSTRRIDYANPDSATVIAEVDDEEPGGHGSARKPSRGGGRGRKPSKAVGKSKKRKAGEDSSEHEDDGDDDGSSDYGSAKKKKRSGVVAKPGPKGKRGRPSGSKAVGKGRPAAAGAKGGRKGRKGKNEENESEDDEGEVVYDDQESNKDEDSPMEEEAEAVASKPAPAVAPVSAKAPPKKRGRPAATPKAAARNAAAAAPAAVESPVEGATEEAA